jgi:hypothetical protein
MKLPRTKSYSDITWVYLPLLTVCYLTYILGYRQIHSFVTVHVVFLGLALILMLSPQRTSRFFPRENRLSWPLWFGGITGFVSLLSGYFYFAHHFFETVLTIDKPDSLGSTLLSTPLFIRELFPFALIALFAVILQYVYSKERHSAKFTVCLYPLFHAKEHSDVGTFCNTMTRTATFFSLCMPLVLIGLSCLSLYMHLSQTSLPIGMNVTTLFAVSLIFWLVHHPKWQSFFNEMIEYKCPPLFTVLIMLFFIIALFIFALNVFQLFFTQNTINYHFSSPTWWVPFIDITNTLLALNLIPLASLLIAIMSRGYRVWEIILATLLIPALMMILNRFPISWVDLSFLNNPENISLGLLLCSFLLLVIFLRPSIMTAIWRGVFPVSITLEVRKSAIYIRSLFIFAIGFIGVFWVTGVYIVSSVLMLLSYTTVLLIMASVIYWLWTLKMGFQKPIPAKELALDSMTI